MFTRMLGSPTSDLTLTARLNISSLDSGQGEGVGDGEGEGVKEGEGEGEFTCYWCHKA